MSSSVTSLIKPSRTLSGRRSSTLTVRNSWKNKDHGRHPDTLLEWCWYSVFGDLLIGYGYRPWHALLISVGMVLLGWWLFQRGYNQGLVTPTEGRAFVVEHGWTHQLSESYPRFNAFIYSLETFVPLLKLQVSQYWIPNANRRTPSVSGRMGLPPTTGGWLRGYLWLHIIAGWVLTTLWVAGL